MKERISRNASTVFFKVLAAVTVLLGAASAILGNVTTKPVGTYLIPSYLETLRSYYLCNTISQCLSILSLLMLVTCVLTLFIGNKVVSICIIIGDLLVFGFFFTAALPYFNKPQVAKAKLIDARYQSSTYGESKYALYFDNGAIVKIPKNDYAYGSKGKTYYVVMCGNKAVEAFDTANYQYSES